MSWPAFGGRRTLAGVGLATCLAFSACSPTAPPPTLQRLDHPGSAMLQLGAVTRPALLLRSGEERRWPVVALPGSRLDLAIGLREPPPRGHLQFRVRSGDRVLLDERISVSRTDEWVARSVTLPVGGDTELVLTGELVRGNGEPLPDDAGRAWIAVAAPRLTVPSPSSRRVLVWISQDTVRADHLGTYGYSRATSPVLDQQARSWIVFDQASATSSWTLPSMASQLTSRYPSWHRAVLPDMGMDPAVPTVFEVLQEQGFTVLGVTANGLLDAPHGLARGFDALVFDEGSARDLNERLLGLLDEWGGGDVALFVHYMDPHHPYTPPAPYDSAFGTPPVRPFRTGFQALSKLTDPADIDAVRTLYDGEIAWTDEQIGDLLQRVQARGLGDGVIVYSADHGEELHDHGSWHHGGTLYEELVHVPFAIRVPGHAGRRHPDPVSLVDLAPTVLDAFGIPAPPSFQGRSLLAAARGERLPAVPVYTETLQTADKNLLLAVRRGSDKLILRRTAGGADEDVRVFDLGADPGERQALRGESETARGLLRLARAYLDRATADAPQPTFLKLEPEALERLRALGYVQ